MRLLKNGLFVLFSALLLVACSSGNSPEKVAESFIQAAATGNVDKAIELINLPEADKNEQLAIKGKVSMMLAQAATSFEQKGGGLKSVKAVNTEYNADKTAARVAVEVTLKNKETTTESIKTIKTKKGWKINL